MTVGHTVVFENFKAGLPKAIDECGQVLNQQRGMGFARWPKVGLDSQMNAHLVTFKPHAAALQQIFRLWNFGNFQQFVVELPGGVLAAFRHGELNVMDASDIHLR